MDMFISNRSRRDITNFCWKHRGKIAVASLGIGAVLGAAYYYYDDGDNETETENGLEDDEKEDGSSEAGKEESTPAGRGTDPVGRGTDPAAVQKRTNEIIAVNDLFDFSLVYFLPTIRQKVKEEVDVTETIQKLKSLMNRETAPDQHVTKSALWREIQLSAFNTLLTTAYAVSTASLLLMVQMHLLVRHRSNSTSSSSTSSDDHSGVFRELMERTFGSFFKSGICDLANWNKEIIGDVFNDVEWTVEKTLKVTHEDLREVLSMMKWRVENGIDGKSTIRELTKLLFRDNICVGAASGEKTTQKSVSFLPSVETPQTGGGQPLRVSAVMDETWKILKTPMFDVALQDITDSVFTFLLRTLWEDVFLPLRQSECDFPLNSTISHPGSPNSPAEMESPQTTPAKEQQQQQRNVTGEHKFTEASVPLAKLLPKLKAAAFKLIPDEISVNGTSDARGNEGSEHDDPFVRSTGVSAPGRSVSVQRIRSMCGADDARSSSFNLCSVLLDKRVA